MLNINSFRFGHEGYYFNTVAIENNLEDRGSWTKHAGTTLGLEGEVTLLQFRNLLSGIDPYSGQPLEEFLSKRKIAAYDFVFSAPKSVSLVGLATDSKIESTVKAAHDKAVVEAMDYFESTCLSVRRSENGRRLYLKTSGALGAQFFHRTSRLSDPHLHSHVVIANLAQGLDGKWSGASIYPAFFLKKQISMIYHTNLRHELTKNLNVSWDRFRFGLAEIKGIPNEAIFVFSQRRQQLMKSFYDKAIDIEYFINNKADLDPKYLRPTKNKSYDLNHLKEVWGQTLCSLGLEKTTLLEKIEKSNHRNIDDNESIPLYIKDLIGEIPKDKSCQYPWKKAASQIEIYRKNWNITDSSRPLGASKFELLSDPDFSLTRLNELKNVENSVRDVSKSVEKSRDLSFGIK